MPLEKLLDQAIETGKIGRVRYRRDFNSENFPETGVRGELLLVCLPEIGLSLSQWIYCGDIIEAMGHHGLLAGTMPELVEYAAIWNGRRPVLALGSIWNDTPSDYYAGCLCVGHDGPELSLRDVDFGWSDDDLFLAVRRQSFG